MSPTAAHAIRVELVESLDRLALVREPYEALLSSAAPGRAFFYRVDMLQAMEPAFASGRRSPFVLLAWRADTLCGVFPLVLERKPWSRAGLRRLALWGSDAGALGVEGDVPLAGNPQESMQAFAHALGGPLKRRFDLLDLRFLRADSASLPALRQAFTGARVEAEEMLAHRAVVPATLTEFRAPRSAGRLRELGRMERRLREAFEVEFRLETTLSAHALEGIMALHMRRQRELAADGHRRESVFSEARTRTALKALLVAAERAGCARHYLLYANGELISFLLTFQEGSTQLAYLTAFDASYHQYGPGSLVFWEAARAEVARGEVERIDYGVGTTQVKALFGIATSTPQRLHWMPGNAPLSHLRYASYNALTGVRDWLARRRV